MIINSDTLQTAGITAAYMTVSGLASGGVTWLVSRATHPLVGGAFGSVVALVSAIALSVLWDMDQRKSEAKMIDLVSATSLSFSLVATGLGYPISLPLTFSLGVLHLVALQLTLHALGLRTP